MDFLWIPMDSYGFSWILKEIHQDSIFYLPDLADLTSRMSQNFPDRF